MASPTPEGVSTGVLVATGLAIALVVVGVAVLVTSGGDGPAGSGSGSGATSGDPRASTTVASTVSTGELPPPSSDPGAPAPPAPAGDDSSDDGPFPGLAEATVRQGLIDLGWACVPASGEVRCALPGSATAVTLSTGAAGALVAMEVSVMSTAEHEWLEYVATLPWQGAEPSTARSWVQEVTSGAASPPFTDTFGGVAYEMTGPASGGGWRLTLGG